MGISSKPTGFARLGKRSQGRLRVRLHAKIITIAATHAAILEDISRKGAKLSVDNPPKPGSDAVLRWDEYESFGTIAWVSGTRCGILFGNTLAEATLLATRTLDEVSHAPADMEIDREAAKAWVEGNTRFGFD